MALSLIFYGPPTPAAAGVRAGLALSLISGDPQITHLAQINSVGWSYDKGLTPRREDARGVKTKLSWP